MKYSESLSSDVGPLWFTTLAVIVILASAWSASTVDEGILVPLVWVIPPFALSLLALGLSGLALLQSGTEDSGDVMEHKTQSDTETNQPESKSTPGPSFESGESDNYPFDGQGNDGPQEVDITDYSDSQR